MIRGRPNELTRHCDRFAGHKRHFGLHYNSVASFGSVRARLRTTNHRAKVAGEVGEDSCLRSLGRSATSQILLPCDVCVPLWSRSCRPRQKLHDRRCDRTDEAYARVQRSASFRMGRVWASSRERGNSARYASRAMDFRQHRPHEGSTPTTGNQLRVGTGVCYL